MEPAPPIVDRLSKCQTRMEPRQPRLLPETLRSSIASPNAPPSHYVRHRCRTCRTLIRGAIDFRPWNRADSRRLAHHSAALDTAHETVPVLNFSHTILRRESTMILPDYIPNAQSFRASTTYDAAPYSQSIMPDEWQANSCQMRGHIEAGTFTRYHGLSPIHAS